MLGFKKILLRNTVIALSYYMIANFGLHSAQEIM